MNIRRILELHASNRLLQVRIGQLMKCIEQINFFLGEYQIHFIEWVENIRIFMSAQHEWKFWCSTHDMKYIWYLPEKSKFSFILYFL